MVEEGEGQGPRKEAFRLLGAQAVAEWGAWIPGPGTVTVKSGSRSLLLTVPAAQSPAGGVRAVDTMLRGLVGSRLRMVLSPPHEDRQHGRSGLSPASAVFEALIAEVSDIPLR